MKTKAKKTKNTKKPVVVLDFHRGIYFGYLDYVSSDLKSVRLTGARHCFYFAAPAQDGEKGTCSLATVGPQTGSKIGPRVTMLINDVSKIIDCSNKATKQWELASW